MGRDLVKKIRLIEYELKLNGQLLGQSIKVNQS